MVRTFAAIDLGSFEVELGIYEFTRNREIRQIDYLRYEIPLGKDTYTHGKIRHELVNEMCEVLDRYAQVMKNYQVESYRAYATSAIREAQNNAVILDQIRVRTGIEVRIISNSEQRLLSYKAIAGKNEEFKKIIQSGTSIVDLGFGSMQLSLFDKDSLVTTQNVSLGAMRLREQTNSVSSNSKNNVRIITNLIDNELSTFQKMYLKEREIETLIGIGDMILTLKNRIAPNNESNYITAVQFIEFYNEISRLTEDQIMNHLEVNSEFASMIIPTLLIYKRMIEITKANTVWIPGIRLTDGVAAEYADTNKIIKLNHDFSLDIVHASKNIAKRYKCQMSHGSTVEGIALKLFDSLKKYHGLKEQERLLLQIAANLHSCGKYITMRDTAECGYNIIMATEIIGLSHTEREILANIIKFNTKEFRYEDVIIKSKPSKHTRLAEPNNLIMMIAKLTALLRLADALDRGHHGDFKSVRFSVKEKELVALTESQEDITVERMSVNSVEEFFEEIFGLKIVLRQKKRG